MRKKSNMDDLYIQLSPGDKPNQANSYALENCVPYFAGLPPLNGQDGSNEPEWSMFRY